MVLRLKREATRTLLVARAHGPEELPNRRRPVVAFAGRSNVGKSSLLNRLLGTTAARVSKTPGKTRGIYFYETAEGHDFADLPGTGFARVPRKERAGWAVLLERFFQTAQAVLVVHLIDARSVGSAGDLAMRDYLESLGVASLPVATKWDRLSATERAKARQRLEAVHGEVIPVSSRTGEGIEKLRREIRRYLYERGTLRSAEPPGTGGTLRSPGSPGDREKGEKGSHG